MCASSFSSVSRMSSERGPEILAASLTASVREVPSNRRNCTYAPGTKLSGSSPTTSSPRTVGRTCPRSNLTNRSDASWSSIARWFACSTSGDTLDGRYDLRNSSRSRSSTRAAEIGRKSNGKSRALRFSLKRLSSSAVATARRGPTLIQTRPSYLTGGASDGSTIITASSQPFKIRFCTAIVGNGTMFPSDRMSERVRRS